MIIIFVEEEQTMNIREYASMPIYHIGEVIDISYKNQGLPNRVRVTGVRMKESDNEWVYTTLLENTGELATIAESFLKERACHRYIYDVYKLPVICRRYAAGFRFCGNFTEKEARRRAKSMKNHPFIETVRMCEAYNGYGNPLSGRVSLWLKYKNSIPDNEPYTPDTGEFEVEL